MRSALGPVLILLALTGLAGPASSQQRRGFTADFEAMIFELAPQRAPPDSGGR